MKVVLVVIWFILSACDAFSEESWREDKSTHFIVYSQEGVSSDFVQKTIRTVENCYNDLGEKLKFRRFDYWTWEKRAKIYIYADKESYLEDSGRKNWSGGSVNIENKIIKCYPWGKTFFEKVLPHELTHIVFREYMGIGLKLPLWLDEGFSCVSEKDHYRQYVRSACQLLKQEIIIPSELLNKITYRNISSPAVFYAYSAGMVYYLWDVFGAEKFLKMCSLLKEDKYSIEEALLEAYSVKTLDELDQRWREYLSKCCD